MKKRDVVVFRGGFEQVMKGGSARKVPWLGSVGVNAGVAMVGGGGRVGRRGAVIGGGGV